MQSFSMGKQKKNRFLKDKVAADAKKKQLDEETAALYDEFAASFDPSESTSSAPSKTFLQAGGGIYRPVVKPLSEMDKMMQEMKSAQARRSRRDSDANRVENPVEEKPRIPPAVPDLIKKREMDAFLEEIKQRQEHESVVGNVPVPELSKGSMDDGDPNSTNLYIGFVAPTITEERLQKIFGEYGEIYSIKIMWPRTDEERARQRNCGFVSFWKRADAEAAKEALQGKEIDGMEIQIGWGKPVSKLTHGISDDTKISENPEAGIITTTVKTPQGIVPLIVPPHLPSLLASSNGMPASVNSARAVAEAAVAAVNASLAQPPVPAAHPERDMNSNDFKIEVILPKEKERRYLIDRTARYVAKDGATFESRIIQNELLNPDFSFLTNIYSEEGKYYRWRTYSFAMGDRERKWRTKPFQMYPNGPFWVPPPEPDFNDSSSDDDFERDRRERRREKGGRYSPNDEDVKDSKTFRDRYKYSTGRQLEKARLAERDRIGGESLHPRDEEKLNELYSKLKIPTRTEIREIMGFALDNSENSGPIVDYMSKMLIDMKNDTTPHMVIARLYVLSDVLHNSAAPVRNASSYRTQLQGILPHVFESLGEYLRNISGRLTARQLQEKVLEVMRVWCEWNIYPDLFLTGLEASFMRTNSDMETVAAATKADNVQQLEIDRSAFERKSRQAGLYVSEAMTALDMFNRLNHLNAYVKAKAAGRSLGEIQPTNAAADRSDTSSVDVDGVPLGSPEQLDDNSTDDEDIDGVPLDSTVFSPPAPPFAMPPRPDQFRKNRKNRSPSPSAEPQKSSSAHLFSAQKKSRWD